MTIYAHRIYIIGKYTGFAVGILDAVLLKSAKYAEKRVIMARFTAVNSSVVKFYTNIWLAP